MTEKDFTDKYGDTPIKTTEDYISKSIAPNYNTEDPFLEYCDNAYDARDGKTVHCDITIDKDENIITIYDDGSGIRDHEKLLLLGGTDKQKSVEKIGKFGVGVAGASASIAKQFRYNKSEPVVAEFESAHSGTYFKLTVGFFPNGVIKKGDVKPMPCKAGEHYTRITFNNVRLRDTSIDKIIDTIEEFYELPIKNGDIIISLNRRKLGWSSKSTFIDGEGSKTIEVGVGNTKVDVKYCIYVGEEEKFSDKKMYEEAALRIYDKHSGRLLSKEVSAWRWFAKREPHPCICGLRCGIFIESTQESYEMFGIKPAKNGVKYAHYHDRIEFQNLKEILLRIYNTVSKGQDKGKEYDAEYDGKKFKLIKGKIDTFYQKLTAGHYTIQLRYAKDDAIKLVNECIKFETKNEKLQKTIDKYKEELSVLKRKNAELERKLNKMQN